MKRNYKRGRDKEYRIVKKLKAESFIAQRSAGSHSPWDIVAIHPERKIIMLIQSKPSDWSWDKQKKLEKENEKFNGVYFVKFIVE